MGTTRDEIAAWFERGKADGATHMIVACDTFDWDDYPVYVKPGQNVREVEKNYNYVNMQKVMEVYNLSMDMNAQLSQPRAFNY